MIHTGLKSSGLKHKFEYILERIQCGHCVKYLYVNVNNIQHY